MHHKLHPILCVINIFFLNNFRKDSRGELQKKECNNDMKTYSITKVHNYLPILDFFFFLFSCFAEVHTRNLH